MLVLTRKIGDRVRIETPGGEVIWVTVTDINRGKVVLGFEAPREVAISRDDWDGPQAQARARSR